MASSINSFGATPFVVQIALVANASAGVLGSWQNTTGKDLYVVNRGIVVDSASDGAATVDAGIAATAVTNDTLIDGGTLNGVAANTVISAAGSNGAVSRVIPAGYYVTAFGSAATTGFAGSFQVTCVELD